MQSGSLSTAFFRRFMGLFEATWEVEEGEKEEKKGGGVNRMGKVGNGSIQL